MEVHQYQETQRSRRRTVGCLVLKPPVKRMYHVTLSIAELGYANECFHEQIFKLTCLGISYQSISDMSVNSDIDNKYWQVQSAYAWDCQDCILGMMNA